MKNPLKGRTSYDKVAKQMHSEAEGTITVVENSAFEPGMALMINGKEKVWITNIENGTKLTVRTLTLWQRIRLFFTVLPYRIATCICRNYVAIVSQLSQYLKNRDK